MIGKSITIEEAIRISDNILRKAEEAREDFYKWCADVNEARYFDECTTTNKESLAVQSK